MVPQFTDNVSFAFLQGMLSLAARPLKMMNGRRVPARKLSGLASRSNILWPFQTCVTVSGELLPTLYQRQMGYLVLLPRSSWCKRPLLNSASDFSLIVENVDLVGPRHCHSPSIRNRPCRQPSSGKRNLSATNALSINKEHNDWVVFANMAARKLHIEMEKVFKKVDEGILLFEESWEKLQVCENAFLRERYELELKKELKKIQRLREKIKTWQSDDNVKVKTGLDEYRRRVEEKMELFKIVERDRKMKAYSTAGLSRNEVDPKEKEKKEADAWLVGVIRKLKTEIEKHEAHLEVLNAGKRKRKSESKREADIKEKMAQHGYHVEKIERVLRALHNDDISAQQVDDLKESVEYYVEAHDDSSYVEDESMYECIECLRPAVDPNCAGAGDDSESGFEHEESLNKALNDVSAREGRRITDKAVGRTVLSSSESPNLPRGMKKYRTMQANDVEFPALAPTMPTVGNTRPADMKADDPWKTKSGFLRSKIINDSITGRSSNRTEGTTLTSPHLISHNDKTKNSNLEHQTPSQQDAEGKPIIDSRNEVQARVLHSPTRTSRKPFGVDESDGKTLKKAETLKPQTFSEWPAFPPAAKNLTSFSRRSFRGSGNTGRGQSLKKKEGHARDSRQINVSEKDPTPYVPALQDVERRIYYGSLSDVPRVSDRKRDADLIAIEAALQFMPEKPRTTRDRTQDLEQFGILFQGV